MGTGIYVLMVVTVFILSSCGLYKYSFDAKTYSIVSNKENRIHHVNITEMSSNVRVSFTAITDGERYFPLENLGRDAYKGSAPFSFAPNKKYQISVYPQGDRHLPDIYLYTDSLGILHP